MFSFSSLYSNSTFFYSTENEPTKECTVKCLEPEGCLIPKDNFQHGGSNSLQISSQAFISILLVILLSSTGIGIIFVGSWLLWRHSRVEQFQVWRKRLMFWRNFANHHQSPHQPSNVEDQHSATNLDTDENMHSEDYDMNTQLQNDPTQVLLKSYSVPFINRPFQKLNLYFENLRFCQIWILIF